jgi:hypothetical protein
MANRDREVVHVVTDEPNETETGYGAGELNIIELRLQLLLCRSLEHLLGVIVNQSVLSLLSPLGQVHELPIAVVYQLEKTVLRVLTSCPMIQNDLQ